MIPSFIGTRMLRKCGTTTGGCSSGDDDALRQPLAVRAAHDDVDDEPDARATPGRRSARPRASPSRRSRRAKVSTAPTTAGTGISARRKLTLNGERYGRGRSGSVDPQLDHRELRRREREQDAEREEAREEAARRWWTNELAITIALEISAALDDRLRRDERAPVQAAERARQLAVLAERVGEPREARDRRRHRRDQDQRAARRRRRSGARRRADPAGRAPISVATPTSGARSQSVPSRVSGPGNAESATTAIAT